MKNGFIVTFLENTKVNKIGDKARVIILYYQKKIKHQILTSKGLQMQFSKCGTRTSENPRDLSELMKSKLISL